MSLFEESYDAFTGSEAALSDENMQDSDVEMTIEEDEPQVGTSGTNEHGSGPHTTRGTDTKDKDFSARDPVNNLEQDRIVIGIDFGTTFSSVAYTVLRKHDSAADHGLDEIKCIGKFPGRGNKTFDRYDVPTELWYEVPEVRTQKGHTAPGSYSTPESNHEETFQSSEDEGPSEDENSQVENDSNKECSTVRPREVQTPSTQYWGFGVQQRLNREHIPKGKAQPLTRFKLLLEHNEVTESVRDDLKSVLNDLGKRKVLKKHTDIYTHYLTQLLNHTKSQLLFSKDFHEDMIVQFVLCVPANWPVRACRIMQNALEEAVKEVAFSDEANRAVNNIFMISEPEAAAVCILADTESELFKNKTTVILDAGGGTIDAVTYKCTEDRPLRLSAEVVKPASKLCGASYINEEFARKLKRRLASDEYLETNGKTLDSIIQAAVTEFENEEKRQFDATDRNAFVAVYIDNLQSKKRKNYYQNKLRLERGTMQRVYKASVDGAIEILKNQLELAESAGHKVQNVILTGGFGQSPTLQKALKKELKRLKEDNEPIIELVIPNDPSTTVARGAVLRALNKIQGPKRITQCSYGFQIDEPFEPMAVSAHKNKKPRKSPQDGDMYINNTIRWVIQAGQHVDNGQEFDFPVKQTFFTTRKNLIYKEVLFMSDSQHYSHYRKSHAQNKGAQEVGIVSVDMSFLRDEGHIAPQPTILSNTPQGKKQEHWSINYEVVLIVEGRSIRFEARWPARSELHLYPGLSQRILAMERVGIAASFEPGTV